MGDPSHHTFERLGELLSISGLGGEDWDLMFANPERVEEFCGIYEREELNVEERSALMELIVASYERRLHEAVIEPDLQLRISQILERDFDLHQHTVEYWSALNSPQPDRLWAVSPLMRRLLSKRDADAQQGAAADRNALVSYSSAWMLV